MECATLEDEVQKLTDRFVKSIDEHLGRKEAEIMKVSNDSSAPLLCEIKAKS